MQSFNSAQEITAPEIIDETQLKHQLIETITRTTAIISLFALYIAEIRALQIGWTPRDLLQIGAVGLIVLLALSRTIRMRHKVPLLIAAISLAGIAGIGSLGMFAGMVFAFPVAVVMTAIFFPVRITGIFSACALLLYGLAAAGFCSGTLTLPPSFLMESARHWAVYIVSVAFFFLVAGIAIYSYRKTMTRLIHQLSNQRDQLNRALNEVQTLSGLLPICASCKKIRDDTGYWNQIEDYIMEHSDARLSHAICPECMQQLYPEYAAKINAATKPPESGTA